jgi:protein gp37
MSDRSKIEWTDASWNPIRAELTTVARPGWYCEHVSEGCRNCYAENINNRLGTGLPFKPAHRQSVNIYLDEKVLQQPLKWKRPRMVFVCSMSDLFGSWVTDAMLDAIFAVMQLAKQHTFQVLTKRPERMREYFRRPMPWTLAQPW